MKRIAGWLAFGLFIALMLVGGNHLEQKNQRSFRSAYNLGFDAGQADVPVEACPYGWGTRSEHWKTGWIRGRAAVKGPFQENQP